MRKRQNVKFSSLSRLRWLRLCPLQVFSLWVSSNHPKKFKHLYRYPPIRTSRHPGSGPRTRTLIFYRVFGTFRCRLQNHSTEKFTNRQGSSVKSKLNYSCQPTYICVSHFHLWIQWSMQGFRKQLAKDPNICSKPHRTDWTQTLESCVPRTSAGNFLQLWYTLGCLKKKSTLKLKWVHSASISTFCSRKYTVFWLHTSCGPQCTPSPAPVMGGFL